MVSYLQAEAWTFQGGATRAQPEFDNFETSYKEEKEHAFLSLLWKHETVELPESFRHWERICENLVLIMDVC